MDTIPKLDRHGLRRFAFVTGAIVACLFGIAIPVLFGLRFPVWPWVVAVVLTGAGTAAPDALRPVYAFWMRFGILLNRITTPIILSVLFYALVTPTGILMRLFRRDTMARDRDPSRDSYRIPSRRQPRENMDKPY